jgi:hypothetical protein
MNERAVAGTTATVLVDAQGETVVHYHAVNSSGHEADKTVTVKVDTVAPTLAVRAPVEGGRYGIGSAVTVAIDCADATSGVASCTPDGSALDTAGPAERVLQAAVTDAAGNSSTKDVHYSVVASTGGDIKLAFVARGDASAGPVQTANTDGTNVAQLADRGDDPVFSPDGTKVAFTSGVGGVRQVFVGAADGSGSVAITNSTTWQASTPASSPDGSTIVFAGDWTEVRSPTDHVIHRALLTVPATGGASTPIVTSDTAELLDPSYARNGATVTFVSGGTIRSVAVTGVPAGQLGTVLVGPLPSGSRPAHPAWSADGTRLVYQVWENETFLADLFVWNVGGSQAVNVTTTDSDPTNLTNPYESWPSWLPDGRIVFNEGGDVWAVPAQAGAAKVLLADLPYDVRNVDASGA